MGIDAAIWNFSLGIQLDVSLMRQVTGNCWELFGVMFVWINNFGINNWFFETHLKTFLIPVG